MPLDPRIQPGSYVVVLDTALRVRAASANVADITGGDAGALPGRAADQLFSAWALERIRLSDPRRTPMPFPLGSEGPVDWGERQCIPYFQTGGIVLEIEARSPPEQQLVTEVGLRDVNDAIRTSVDTPQLLQVVCEKLGHLLMFDRVIAYELHPEGTGVVSAEFNNGTFPGMRGLHYRQEDFADEARRAYENEAVLQAIRVDPPVSEMMGDVEGFEYTIARRLGCRLPYPALRRFMRELSITTTLSLALYNQDKLWGIVFAHARRPLFLDYQLRTFVHLVGNLTSQALTYRAFNQAHRKLVAADYIHARLRENIAAANSLLDGLHYSDPSLLDVIPNTAGAAILLEGQLVRIGSTPPASAVSRLLEWAEKKIKGREIYHQHCLESVYSEGSELRDTAAGVLLAPLNANRTEWIVWFRPEIVQEVTYGSRHMQQPDPKGARFTPTVETRYGCARPWMDSDVDAARDLQSYVRDVVMDKYSQLSRVNHQLQLAYDEMQSFSYTVSHDLRAPLRGIDGFAEIFIEDYGTRIDKQGKALIHTIQQNAVRMNQYIADILELSRVGRATLSIGSCSVRQLVASGLRNLPEPPGSNVKLEVAEDLPPIKGDFAQLTTVFHQLLSNAIKYSVGRETQHIRVGFRAGHGNEPGEFFISDNGIGIAAAHRERVFGMFNRLVRQDEYAGNGVGLAIVRRIITRHGGEVRIESEPGSGTTVLFYTRPH
ncbi:ATP-binding protein [Lewinella sp. IMCC34183]|uniref:GAF domain-containing sensor histidine kinase n=1 Tax=Lewinella sp. IMCC34183 TaxID=2248762 RepID=UPI000E226D46|nr:ATP-binding protein [Lewinella sp. IMCC34183]